MINPINVTALLKDSLKKAFLKTAQNNIHGFIVKEGETASLNRALDVISRSIYKFWTKDFLDDLIMIQGSFIWMSQETLIQFSRIFYGYMYAACYQAEIALTASTGIAVEKGIFHQDDLIDMVVEIIRNEQLTVVLDQEKETNTILLDPNQCDYLSSFTADVDEKSIRAFLVSNSWLIPFYLFFVTDAYEELVLEFDSVSNR